MQKIACLYDASQAVMSTFELDEVLQQILQILKDYFQLQNAAVCLIEGDRKEFHVRAEFGRGKREGKPKIGEGIIGSAARLKRPVYVPDVTRDTRYVMGFTDTRSELAIPLMIRDEVVGVLDMQSHQQNFFDKQTIDLLTLFSTQASIAIANAHLYSRERRRASQLEAINQIARQTTAIVELDELLEKVCQLVHEYFHADHIALLLVEDGALHLREHKGRLTSMFETGASLPVNTGLLGRALDTGKPVLVTDVSQSAEYKSGFAETRCEICVPLTFLNEKLGVLSLESARVNGFDETDLKPLEAVGDICAGAIKNAGFIARARKLAYLDGLTGIFNRRFFELRITEELERATRYGHDLSVVMIDIDHFKRLNDEFGHLLGDEVLRQVSAIFLAQLRKGDIVCRYGGEEFSLLLPETTGTNAMEVAEKLRRLIESYLFPGVPVPVTISAGIAAFPLFGKTRDQLVAAADNALYTAKQSGRNMVISAENSKRVSAT